MVNYRNVLSTKEEDSVQHLWRDLLFGLRILWKKPGFTAAAVLSLVLGIGLNTTVFTLFDTIFLRPLPVEDLDSLAAVYTARRNEAGEYMGRNTHSFPNFVDLQERSRSFSGLALYFWQSMNLTGGSEPLRGTGMFVSAGYFDVLGVRPHEGRFFAPEEDTDPGTHPVAVLSHGFWTRAFGGDAAALGQTVRINGREHTVVGVAPRGFKGTDITVNVDVWVPSMMFPSLSPYGAYFENRTVSVFSVFGRLSPGVSLAAVGEELMGLSRQMEEEFPRDNEGLGAEVLPLLEGTMRPGDRAGHVSAGWILLTGAGLILLIACINVAILLLVRGVQRRREVAIRQAIGAGRGRVAAQLLIESFLLFSLGGLLSLPASRLFLDFLWSFRPPQFAEDAVELGISPAVFLAALAATLVTGVVFGSIPALSASRADLVGHLKEAASRSGAHRRWLEPRRWLVAGQVALALAALIGAGLFLGSLKNALATDLGFEVESMVAVTFAPGEQGYEESRARNFYRQVLERVRALPGVSSATLSENRLLRGGVIHQQVFVEGRDTAEEIGVRSFHRTNAVVPGYFAIAGIELVQGRDFDDSIREDGPLLAIVNETMAESSWPGESAVGKRFHFDFPDTPVVEVLGVARDAKYRHVYEEPQFFIYVPEAQRFCPSMTLHARTDGDPTTLLAEVRREVQSLAPDLPLADVQTMRGFVDDDLWQERVAATMLGAFGLLALALAMIGVYGVLAESVSQRRRELGIRMALGAGRGDVWRVVLLEGAGLVAAGSALGLMLCLLLTKSFASISDQLHGISVVDVKIYAGATLMLATVAFLGFLVPSWRASRTNPAATLRDE